MPETHQRSSNSILMRTVQTAPALCLLLFLFCATAYADREVTDMLGRKVTVPDTITKVYGSSPPATLMTYAMDPDLLVGLNMPVSPKAKPFISPKTAQLPILGGWFGNGRVANREAILAAKPDVIIAWIWQPKGMDNQVVKKMEPLGFPIVCIRLDSLPDYPKALEFLGDLFNMKERGDLLAQYGQQALDDVARISETIPEEKRPTVYYAEEADGLSTECDNSMHAEMLNLCKANNVHKCMQEAREGLQKISMEQVFNYNPEVIVFHEPLFAEKIKAGKQWQLITAVKTGRTYQIPTLPFNWFDRPPSFMRFLGLKWTMHALYPEAYPIDMEKETVDFFHLFLGVDLTQEQTKKLLHL